MLKVDTRVTVEISHKVSYIESFKENILVYKILESPILST